MTRVEQTTPHRLPRTPIEPPPSAVRGVWVDQTHAVIRRGMVSALTTDHVAVVGESVGLHPTPDLARTHVLVFEADGSSFPRVRALVAGRPVGLVATVREPSGPRLQELAEAGVAAILLLDDLTPETLVRTARSVSSGRVTLTHSLLMRLMDHAARVGSAPAGSLSARERQVLQMLADGEDTRAIACGLNYSERTVKNVVHDVLTKMNCRTRAQAVGVAARAGII
ncbi:response regulator transcription factor [Actinotalea ferrariae]|uniref:helix-turn-helix transcriptional regulator n=1 Tax=Actinotalea ferrariae TaxID=1386098 RepID=UPI001C8C9AAA|nr:response regulator transcription factor [Actinotalea ferrariae]MBX9246984.1 response regulator transcription factor [Actinotalea ferrariae]